MRASEGGGVLGDRFCAAGGLAAGGWVQHHHGFGSRRVGSASLAINPHLPTTRP